MHIPFVGGYLEKDVPVTNVAFLAFEHKMPVSLFLVKRDYCTKKSNGIDLIRSSRLCWKMEWVESIM